MKKDLSEFSKLAGEYHGGQFSELYKVSSSGSYNDGDVLWSEIKAAIRLAQSHGWSSDAQALQTMLEVLTGDDSGE